MSGRHRGFIRVALIRPDIGAFEAACLTGKQRLKIR